MIKHHYHREKIIKTSIMYISPSSISILFIFLKPPPLACIFCLPQPVNLTIPSNIKFVQAILEACFFAFFFLLSRLSTTNRAASSVSSSLLGRGDVSPSFHAYMLVIYTINNIFMRYVRYVTITLQGASGTVDSRRACFCRLSSAAGTSYQ